jgi:hypothetical protein
MSQKIKTSVEIDGSLSASQIANATTDTDKFLVSDGGTIKYRTGAELATDLGIAAGVTSKVQHQVKAGVAINKGQAVYVTGADGTNMIVGLASNATEATSSKTMGLLNATVSVNLFADVITEGLLSGLNTSAATVGDPIWLGTDGNLIYGLANKPYAPSHLVFIGIVTRVNANNGEIFVKIQNGFELNEIHDVDLKTTTPINGHLLGFNGTLWVNKTIAGWLGYTPQAQLNGTGFVKASGTTITYDNTSYYSASNPNGYISTYTETDTLASVTGRGASTSTLSTFDGGLNIGNAKLRWGGNTTPTLGFPFTGGPNAFWIDVNDGDTGGIAIDNDGTTIYGAGDSGHVFRVIDEDVYQATSNVDASTTFRVQQGQNGGGYIRGVFEVTDYLNAGNSARAPIFYDSNDTGYYVNPASTSVLSNVVLQGASAISFYGAGSGTYNIGSIYSSTSINSWEAPLETDSYTAARVPFILTWRGGYAAKGGLKLIGGASAELGGNVVLHSGNISSYAVPSSRTITINGTSYDLSANRSWTVTASETDTLATVVSRGATANSAISVRNGYNIIKSDGVTTGGQLYYDSSINQLYLWNSVGSGYFSVYTNSAERLNISSGGAVTANVDMRSPIFYDSNNTGFYVDPASTTKLNALTLSSLASDDGMIENNTGGYFHLGGWGVGRTAATAVLVNTAYRSDYSDSVPWSGVTSKPSYLMYYQGFTLDANTMDTNATGFTYSVNAPYTGPIAKFSTGGGYDLQLNAPYGGNGYGLAFRTRNGDAGTHNSWQYPAVYNVNANGGGDLYATRYYDQNNTGYYVDPASTSYVNSVDARGFYTSSNPWGTSNSAWFPNGITTPNVTSWLYGTVYLGNAPGNGAGTQATASGHIISTGEHQAAIFYDYNNTAYYVDAASNSVLNTLTVQGGTNNFNGITYFRTNNGGYLGSTDSAKLQAYSDSNNAAFMSFHKGGHYAVNFGLDADNVMRLGGWSASSNRWQLDMSGNMTVAGDVTAYSDRRVKENIVTVDNALEKVNNLRGVYYTRTDSEDKKTKLGVIAQEILEVVPEVVGQDNDGMYNVSYGNLAGLFIEAIKEQQTQIEELKKLVNKLTNK